jgi:hypothetical protein
MELMMENDKTADLISKPLNVINIGLEGFATELKQQGVSVIHVDWSPPAGGDPKIADLLSKLGT